MNLLWILAAFLFGAVISRIVLPPLVGYLLAGFAMNGIGVTGGELLETLADAGVTLLLFTIGLKLKIKSLAKPEVWAGTSIHMIITVIIFGFLIRIPVFSGIPLFGQLTGHTSLLIAFALSFSSTVFAVKVLEGKKEMASRHSAAAINRNRGQEQFLFMDGWCGSRLYRADHGKDRRGKWVFRGSGPF